MVGKRANRINLYKKQTKKPNQNKQTNKQKNQKTKPNQKTRYLSFPT